MYEITDHLLSLLVKSYYRSGFVFLLNRFQLSQSDRELNRNKTEQMIKDMIIPMNILFFPIKFTLKDNKNNHLNITFIVLFPFNRKREPIAWSELIKLLDPGSQTENYTIQMYEPETSKEMTVHLFYSFIKRFCAGISRMQSASDDSIPINHLYFYDQPETIMGAHARSAAGELCMPTIAWRKYIYENANQLAGTLGDDQNGT